jgi:hypothetical protein
MASQTFLPTTDLGKAAWLENFANKLPTYTAKYGITATEKDDATASAFIFSAMLNFLESADTYKQAITSFKDDLRDGVPAGGAGGTLPQPPTVPVSPPGFLGEGIFKRMTSLAKRIKAHTAYLKTDGEALGIEAPNATNPDWGSAKGKITHAEAHIDEVIIEWKKGKASGVAVYASLDGNTFTKLGIDLKSPYNDTRKNQTSAPEYRYYKVRYLLDDREVGHFSDVVQVLVDIH